MRSDAGGEHYPTMNFPYCHTHPEIYVDPETYKAPDADKALRDWPKTERGNFLCTPDRPMPLNAPGRWEHTRAGEVGEQEDGYPGGDIVTMRCKDCGATWREELPQ